MKANPSQITKTSTQKGRMSMLTSITMWTSAPSCRKPRKYPRVPTRGRYREGSGKVQGREPSEVPESTYEGKAPAVYLPSSSQPRRGNYVDRDLEDLSEISSRRRSPISAITEEVDRDREGVEGEEDANRFERHAQLIHLLGRLAREAY